MNNINDKKCIKINGKYIPSKEQKIQYLETYKNKPCYNLKINCPLCNASYIKACEHKHNKTKKHIFNLKIYEDVKDYILKHNIIDENEQYKIYEETKNKAIYNIYLEKIKIKNPSYIENIKLFDCLKI
jgi:hypothetical protein